jgi:ribonuclease HI
VLSEAKLQAESMPEQKFYAVAVGRDGPRIYSTWNEARSATQAFAGQLHKSFSTRSDAESWLSECSRLSSAAAANDDATNDDADEPEVPVAVPVPSVIFPVYDTHGALEPAIDSLVRAFSKNFAVSASEVADSKQSATLCFHGRTRGCHEASGAGAVLLAADGSALWLGCQYLGKQTNNQAAYRALILGLTAAVNQGASTLTVKSDSHLVVMQMQQQQLQSGGVQSLYRCTAAKLRALNAEARTLAQQFGQVQWQYAAKQQLDARAVAMAVHALDTRADYSELNEAEVEVAVAA